MREVAPRFLIVSNLDDFLKVHQFELDKLKQTLDLEESSLTHWIAEYNEEYHQKKGRCFQIALTL